jgi:hypothetical protein
MADPLSLLARSIILLQAGGMRGVALSAVTFSVTDARTDEYQCSVSINRGRSGSIWS